MLSASQQVAWAWAWRSPLTNEEVPEAVLFAQIRAGDRDEAQVCGGLGAIDKRAGPHAELITIKVRFGGAGASKRVREG